MNWKKNKFINESLYYSGALIGALLVSYFFHMIATRLLGISGYGLFSKYFGIFSFLTLPTFLVQSYVAREVALGKNPSKSVIIDVMKILIPIAIILPIFDINFVVVSTGIIAYFLYVYRGYLQGKHFKKILSLNIFFEAVVRVGFLILLVYFFKMNFYGAILAFTFTYIVMSLPSVKMPWGSDKSNLLSLFSFLVAAVTISLPTTIGLFMASYALPLTELSRYSVNILLSKILVFVAISLGMSFLPNSVENKKEIKFNFKISLYTLLIFALILSVAPHLFAYLFPPEYSLAIIKYLPVFTLGMLLIGISYMLMNVLWAEREDKLIFLPNAIFILIYTYFVLISHTIYSQAIGLLLSSTTLLASLILIKFLKFNLVRA